MFFYHSKQTTTEKEPNQLDILQRNLSNLRAAQREMFPGGSGTPGKVSRCEPLATLPVFFLKANPRMQIFLSVTVLKSASTMRRANRERWKLLKETTWVQYSATSGRFRHSLPV